MEDILYWLWMTQLKGLGPVKQSHLLHKYGNPKNVWQNKNALQEKYRIQSDDALERAKRIYNKCNDIAVNIVSLDSEKYPYRLKNLPSSPILIYYRGKDISMINAYKSTTGIVGARRCTVEDKKKAVDIANKAVEKKSIIVSGMAKGIDSYAHTACVKKGGITAAILGCGLDICYPKEHDTLMEAIINKGIVISEYPPGTTPAKYRFPARNRIIAGLSDELYVIAAGRNSGALITEKYFNEYKRGTVWHEQYMND